MGTWSTALFGSDTATDARDEWLELVREGTPAAEATSRVLSTYQDDDDERDVAIFSLAATAWRHGRLSSALRDEALAAIASGRDLRRWEDEAPKLAARRRTVLSQLDVKLRAAAPAQTHLRPAPASRPSFPNGALLIVDLGGSRLAVCRVRNKPQRKGAISNFEPLRWDRSTEPSAEEARKLSPLVTEPAGSWTDPAGLRHQVIGPHRCGVIFRRGETRDERLRVIADVWPGLAPRTTTGHWSLSLQSWTDHLANLIERGVDPLARPRIEDAVLEFEPDEG
jgi:hypothetical protein